MKPNTNFSCCKIKRNQIIIKNWGHLSILNNLLICTGYLSFIILISKKNKLISLSSLYHLIFTCKLGVLLYFQLGINCFGLLLHTWINLFENLRAFNITLDRIFLWWTLFLFTNLLKWYQHISVLQFLIS